MSEFNNVIDWEKVQTIEDVIKVLKGLEITFDDVRREKMEKIGVPMISIDPDHDNPIRTTVN